MIRNIIYIISIMLILNQCSLLKPLKSPEVKYYQPTFVNFLSSCKNKSNETISVSNTDVFAPYNSKFMFYSNNGNDINYYKLNEWTSEMGTIINQLIIQKLEQSCLFKGVTSTNLFVTSNYRFIAQIMRFQQYIQGNKSQMQLIVFVQIINNSNNTVIKNKKFIDIAEVSPDINGYLKGADITIKNFLNELYLWLK